MKNTLLFFLFLSYSFACLFAQEKFLKKNGGLFVKDFTFSFENDRIPPSNTDEDFTTGIRLYWKARYYHIPLFLGFNPPKNNVNTPVSNPNHLRNFSTFANGIYYYTPRVLDNPLVDPTDRPYASFQYIAFGRYSDRRKLSGDHSDNSYERFESELQVGLVGGPLAKNLQRWTHEILPGGSPVPEGWDHQIGGRDNRIAVNYALEYEALWLNSRIWEKQRKKKYYGCHYYNLFQAYNLTAFLNGNIGNIKGDIGFGLQLNLLNLNATNRYSLDFRDDGKQDFPSGSPPVIKLNCIAETDTAITFQHAMKNEFVSRSTKRGRNLLASKQNAAEIAKDAGIQQPIYYSEWEVSGCRNRKQIKKQNAIAANQKVNTYLESRIKALKQELNHPLSDSLRLCKEYALDSLAYLYRMIRKKIEKDKDLRPFYDSGGRFHNKRFAMSFFIRPELNYVAFNGFLQGVMFNDNSVHTIDIITPFVFEGKVGATLKFDFLELQYVYTFRSSEFPGNPDNKLRSSKPWHTWGTINLSVRPDMITDWFQRNNYRRRIKRNYRRLKSIP